MKANSNNIPNKQISPLINISNLNDKDKNSLNSQTVTTDRNADNFKLEEFKQKDKCTYFEYGDIPINQESYCCEICDPNKTEMICYECFINCHKYCAKEEMKEEEAKEDVTMKKEFSFFICECGKKKHEIERKNDKELEKKCQFGDFDMNMKRKFRTFCKTCGYPICHICYLMCHKKRNGCNVEKKSIRDIKDKDEPFECGCVNQKHSNIIAMTQIITRIIDREEFEDVKSIWKLQTFNNFCLTKMSSDLFDETVVMINDFKNDVNFKKNSFNVCDRFVRLGKNIFKSQKYFYFKDTYVSKYPYYKLIEAIVSFKNGHFEKYGNFICSLCFFLYFFHLKKDFQNIKGLCIIDYFVSSPLDRILYRRLINSRNLYTYELYDKYYNEEQGGYCLDQICIQLLEVLDKAINDFSIKRLDKCLKNYFTIFKIVYFCLKRFLFSFESLSMFVDRFMKLTTNIYHFIIEHIKSDKNQREFKVFFSTLMNYITKINCAIVFNYNDLVLEQIIFHKSKKYNEYTFLHYQNDFSKKIIRILIITSIIYGSFTINSQDKDKEYLSFLNNLIEIALLTNNIYFRRLNEVSFESFTNFYKRVDKIKQLEQSVNYVVKHPPPESEQNYSPSFIEMKAGDNSLENTLRGLVFNLKQQIEMKFTLYFHYQKSILEIQEEVCKCLIDFCSSEYKLTTLNNNNTLKKEKQFDLNECKTFDKENRDKTYSNILKRELIKRYKTKIQNVIANTFSFMKSDIIIEQSGITILIDELILSSFDTTLTKIFFMDKTNKLLDESHMEIVLNFLLIYCMNKEGLKNFCLGRNFRRVIKALALFPKISIKFLYYVFKGIYLNNINIKQHKKLPKIIKDLLHYLEVFLIKSTEDEYSFKTDFCYIVKIFYYLSELLTFEQLFEIKNSIYSIIKSKKLVQVKHFGLLIPLFFIYSKDGSIERNADPNIKILSSKFKYEIDLENEINTNQQAKIEKKDEDKNEEEKSEEKEEEIKQEKNNKKKENLQTQLTHYKSDLLSKYLVKLKDLFEDGKNDSFKTGKRIDPKLTTTTNEKFLFSYLHLISFTTFYSIKDEFYTETYKFLNLDFLKYLLGRRYLKLKYRIILLRFLQNFYLTDQINEKDQSINIKKYPNSEEYFEIIQSKKGIQIETSKMTKEEMDDKLKEINCLKTIIEIINKEMNIMNYVINDEKNKVTSGLLYITEVINIVKTISNIFITYDLCSHIILWFYEMVKQFTEKNFFFIRFLRGVYRDSDVSDIDFTENLNDYKNGENELDKRNYDIYNKEELYLKLFTEFQTLYIITSFNIESSLNKFLHYYKNANDMDFKIFSLNPVQDDFAALTETSSHNVSTNFTENLTRRNTVNINNINKKDKKKKTTNIKKSVFDKCYIHFRKSKELYIRQFVNLSKLSLINIIFSKSNDITIEFKDIFFEYIISSFFSVRELASCNLTSLFILTNKILFYDYEKTQNTFVLIMKRKNDLALKGPAHTENSKPFDVELFDNIKNLLEEQISLQIISSKNTGLTERYKEISILTKNIIQFFQLLGEGHNKVFQKLLVNGKSSKSNHYNYYNENNYNANSEDAPNALIDTNKTNSNSLVTFSSFAVLCNSLNSILKLLNLFNNDNIQGELSYDKLIVIIFHIIDCIIEFFQGTNKESYIDMYLQVKVCFDSIKSVIKLKIPGKDNSRRRFIIVLKTNLLGLISSMIEEGSAEDPDINSLKDIMIAFQPIDLFDEIVGCFDSLYEQFEEQCKGYTLENEEIQNCFIELYKFDIKFQLSIELNLAFKIFYLLKVIAEVYNRVEVVDFFKKIETRYQKITENTVLIPLLQNKESKKSKIKNKIPLIEDKKEFDQPHNADQSNNFSINSNEVLNNNTNIPNKEPHQNEEANSPPMKMKTGTIAEEDHQKEDITNDKKKYNIYSFLSKIMTRIQIRNNDDDSNRDFSFFVVPPICFLLSNSTKISFCETVDRDTVATKIITLIDETDYFIYEMFYNKMHMINFSSLSKLLCNMNIKKFEYVNYLLFVIQNILIVYHNYSKEPIPLNEKSKRYFDGICISIIHLIFIVFVLSIWFIYKFELQFKHKIMQHYKKDKFIFSKGENRVEQLTETDEMLLKKIGANLTVPQKISIIIKDTILFNREVNMFVFSFIFIALYLVFGNAILLSVPLLFIANLNNILFGIVFSLELRIKQLIIVLLFNYIIVYLFSWFAFYYFPELFEFEDLYDVNEDTLVTEKMCSSMVQCFMTMLNYGVRNGGGIGDVIPKLSYIVDPGYFVAGFFFVVLFHILVIWIMINLFFGIIVDSFAALREKTYRIEEDKKNTCYICQMTRDSAMNKNINFDNHVNTIHSMWNYVYFMTYLHINNDKNFKSLETFVWDKIPASDTSWLPIGEENKDD